MKFAMRRWKLDLAGVVACIAMVLVAYHPVAFGGKTFDTSTVVAGVNGLKPPAGVPAVNLVDGIRPDRGGAAWQTTPWAWIVHRQYTQGTWPLWTPYQGAGEPLAGNVQSAVFDPLMIGMDIHPTIYVLDMTYLVVFILGAVAMYLFVRSLGGCVLAAVAASGAFTMGGFFAMDTSQAFVRLYDYLPILFLTVDRWARTHGLRWMAAMGIAFAGAILAGMPEATFFVLLATEAYALFRVLRAPAGTRSSMASGLGLASVFGLALATPLLLLFAQYLPLSFNSHNVTVGLRTAATGALLYWMIPFANGYPVIPRVSGFQFDRGWIGQVASTLAVVAGAAPKVIRRFGGWFFLAGAVLVLARNHSVPFFQWIGRLPVFDRADSTVFAPPLAEFFLAVGVGVGIDAIARGEIHWRRLLAAMVVFGLLVGWLLDLNRPVLAVAHDAFARRNYLLAVSGAATVLLGASLVVSLRRLAWVRPVAVGAVVVMLLFELYALFPRTIYARRADPYRLAPWMALLHGGAASEPCSRIFAFDQLLYPNTAGVFGLQDVRTLNGLYVSRYATYLRDFVFPFGDRFTGDGMNSEQVQNNPMFDLLGVRYVATTEKLLDHFAGVGQYSLVGSDAGVSVYENGHRLPRSFVVQDVHSVVTMDDAASYLSSLSHKLPDGTNLVDRFDPSRQAVVEMDSADPRSLLPPPLVTPGSPRPVRIVSYDSQRVEINVAAGAPGLLVLTDTYFPGWRATVNGHPAPVLPTDVAFRGVMLGDGTSTVVFSYRSPGGALGWAIPLLAAACFGVAAVVARRRAGRRAELPVAA